MRSMVLSLVSLEKWQGKSTAEHDREREKGGAIQRLNSVEGGGDTAMTMEATGGAVGAQVRQ